jgi:hypothetical protein
MNKMLMNEIWKKEENLESIFKKKNPKVLHYVYTNSEEPYPFSIILVE